jgi:nucleotide-binding universal stress UspA family protein
VTSTIIYCTDGSDLATAALASGQSLLRPPDRVVLTTVVDRPDESLVTGASGFAGGSMTPDEFDAHVTTQQQEAAAILEAARPLFGDAAVEGRVLLGSPGAAICDLAAELGADAIVMGSRGRGGMKRALLGSVSDHVLRNAPCAVVITPAEST